ncbi:hypothetical protein MGU_01425 [Metarhizium guizhouense ARSEF 977]|uniref:Transcobalamin-like C-terminal domain-containing protein n=1 Tax=Metarhizium guizhouense (strain ARSEF 977) TaxID=1276136 RepID=A0A0B4GV98_METGA|nr:hypothetical protein MGU_01425 [Metarhizium guizhouense ARSEF 977]
MQNRPQNVFVRVEGSTDTIFNGQVQSQGHKVMTKSGEAHNCDGTNCGRNPTAGNTPTASLDTASKGKFTFSGEWSDRFGDILINEIGGEAGDKTRWWHIFVNGQYLQVGGGQYQTKPNDHILWAYDKYPSLPLKLDILSDARVDHETLFSVRNWETQDPVDSATVAWVVDGVTGKVTTDKYGLAIVIFKKGGKSTVRAEKAECIRSDTLTVNVAGK